MNKKSSEVDLSSISLKVFFKTKYENGLLGFVCIFFLEFP